MTAYKARMPANQARAEALSRLEEIFGKELSGVSRLGLARGSDGTPTVRVVLQAGVDPTKIGKIPDHFADWPVEILSSQGVIALQ